MGLFDRIGTLLKSNLNDLISRAENPEKLLEQAIEDMKRQLVESKSKVAVAIAHEKKLSKDLDLHTRKAEEWEQRAMAAVRAERDDLAMQALDRKKEHEAVAAELEGQVATQRDAVAALKQALKIIHDKHAEAERHRQALLARASTAAAQRVVAETLVATNDPKALAPMAKLADKIDRIEAEAQARLEIAAMSTGMLADPLEEQFKQLGAGRPDRDDLAALKQKMLSAGAAPKPLPAGEGDTGD